ncbi:hypothetical protein [Sulfuricurvum sp. RIFCSPLOWO2_12_FULL_43_24]|uniref:hypothetical protein n=1 Tax=Sulfuricurvum sp. RIFCSPLOWO2_12_FULL_43_24 TaxID=1802247 RepID=UPI0008C8889D|nr:hypothetical protein [Sulfuricurvum sp. RIFCSPLOWO2_12_FULL_43_24]OHD84828.1 MAG: hypothetical protein A3J39_03880 [Sulfuricurvum sp. RIFCSPHIGHO2_12_FULL_44_8]OHD84942.1 MAG: hypothetical protein A3D90_02645 [Sulfuricurvum sp. RIFCSPHIGHO2_02_FULL_43_9]OHD85156.1 MAG: hypothetical protein A2Y52_04175 [Sulfuricurvum sp. RIFCSPLOWO2_02_43_6]OHD88410.1 MAG: hypothetical protein A3G19_10960 [Sulfuricurvum sp. RIFCSPLOWO2_12_FULL_43_24]
MSEALKELFDAYKHLPVGVMFFKEHKLFFVNDHLRTVLLLQNLGSDEVIHIIGDMVGLENASHESLCDFLSCNGFFLYRDRILQIDQQHFDNTDVFVIVRVTDESINTIDKTRSLRELRQDKITVDAKLSDDSYQLLNKALGNWEKNHFPSVVLYKGIPIKGDCTIVHAHNGEIAIRVEKKQLSAAAIGILWLIGSNREKMLSGEVSKYDLNQSVVWLKNLQMVADGFHIRQVIRYGASLEDKMMLSINGKRYTSSLHDVSEKGVSIQTDDAALLIALSSAKGKTLNAELSFANITITVHAVWLYTIALEAGTLMKTAFTIGYDLHNGSLLREWLNSKQLQLIKEVRTFVQMIPAPPINEESEWII